MTRFLLVVTHEQEGWLCGTGCIRIRINCRRGVDICHSFGDTCRQGFRSRGWLKHHAKGVNYAGRRHRHREGATVRLSTASPSSGAIAAILDKAEALRAKRREAVVRLVLKFEVVSLRSAFRRPGDQYEKHWSRQSAGDPLWSESKKWLEPHMPRPCAAKATNWDRVTETREL